MAKDTYMRDSVKGVASAGTKVDCVNLTGGMRYRSGLDGDMVRHTFEIRINVSFQRCRKMLILDSNDGGVSVPLNV